MNGSEERSIRRLFGRRERKRKGVPKVMFRATEKERALPMPRFSRRSTAENWYSIVHPALAIARETRRPEREGKRER